MQTENQEHKAIERLKSELVTHLGWGNVEKWHSAMFTELGEMIFDKCQVMLSPATLKRFWGVVSHEGNPSISTLDTLSQFLGYANWRDFKLKSGTRARFRMKQPGKAFYLIVGFLIAVVTGFLISIQLSNQHVELGNISFSSRTVSDSYPNSVVFDFDIGQVRSDSLYIQQYWDPTKTIKIKSDQNQATGIYYFPGYFRAQLWINGQSVASHDLFLKSNGWLGTIDYEPVPKYFEVLPLSGQGLTFPNSLLDEVSGLKDPVTTTFHFVKDLGSYSGDNFTLDATLKIVLREKWAVCQAARIFILGTSGAMIIPFSKTGCSSDNNLMLNDYYLDGKKHDLSVFGVDLSDFQNVGISVNNKEARIYINETEVYKASYQETMGRLVGVRFRFLGLGEVESFSVKDLAGSELNFL